MDYPFVAGRYARVCRTGRVRICLLQRAPLSIQHKWTANQRARPGRNCMTSRLTAIFMIAIGLSGMASIGGASALDYPTRPVRWVVGYPPGGATDIIARLIGQGLSERLGQQFVIENKPGAGNNIATE